MGKSGDRRRLSGYNAGQPAQTASRAPTQEQEPARIQRRHLETGLLTTLPLHHAYLDESGTTTPFRDTECFLVVAVIEGGHLALRRCTQRLKRLYRKAKLAAGGELKAVFTPWDETLRLLDGIAQEDVHIVAVVVDKRGVSQGPTDPEGWYRAAVARACWHCASCWPSLHIILDKRYTQPILQRELEKAIRTKLAPLDTKWIPIEQLDSTSEPGLQLADFVAWAIARKYERGECAYYDRIRAKIVVEEVIKAT